MEGVSLFVIITLASLFLLMLLTSFFLLRTISRLNDSIKNCVGKDAVDRFMIFSHTVISEIKNVINEIRGIPMSMLRKQSLAKTEISIVNIDELKDISENLDQFTKGIKDLSAFLTGVQELNQNLIDHNQRTDALVTIADFYKKQMADMETRKDAIRASVVKIDDQTQSALKMFEENSQKGLNLLQQTFMQQIDLIEKASQSSLLSEKFQHIDAALKAVALLQPLHDSISKLNDRLLSINPENFSLSCNTLMDNVKPYDLVREIKEKERINAILSDVDLEISKIEEEKKRKEEYLDTLEEEIKKDEIVIVKQQEDEIAKLSKKKTLLQDKLKEIDMVEYTLELFDRGMKVSHRVDDDSMAPTIANGDDVIVEPQKEGYYENDIVYVRLLDCYRIRRVIRLLGGGELEVRGDAKNHSEYIVMADIIGKVIAIKKMKNPQIVKFYGNLDQDGTMIWKASSELREEYFYQINLKNENDTKGELVIREGLSTDKMKEAIKDRSHYLNSSACDITSETESATRVETVKGGTVEKLGYNWKITKRVQVKIV